MNQSIATFLDERKAVWLKAKQKAATSEEEQLAIQQKADEKFSLSTWLPDAAKRATWLSIVSHPAKFSHPSAKTSSVIAEAVRTNDGYLRTGNIGYDLDVFGNAAAMDVYKFLCLPLDDSQTVLQHLEQDSALVKQLFDIPTFNYESLRSDLLAVKQSSGGKSTDALVKQVFFPVHANYHLLSILTPSGLMTQAKNRIDSMRFSEASKQARECRRKDEFHADGYDDIMELTVTAYGGTQPQNISVLNSQNAGRAYLLMSVPPTLERRQVRLPVRSFFRDSLPVRRLGDNFLTLDRLIHSGINNLDIRTGINNTLKFIIDSVLQQVFKIRSSGIGWSEQEHYQGLPLAQRIWLDDKFIEQREQDEAWAEEIAGDLARWIINAYEYLCKDSRTRLSDDEWRELANLAEEAINADKEFFK
jgi:CRISPR-associated protein Csy1